MQNDCSAFMFDNEYIARGSNEDVPSGVKYELSRTLVTVLLIILNII
jgi:hypothetical protein